ncbi:MAG: LLM class F420-dependent oxidoreductase [Acidimicrobiia bacterium]|nr:LLM class F420-dependent oxidoreductase [Acidimicrobiia bacterium]
MRLGLALPWDGAGVAIPVETVKLAERLGFDSVWTAEAYGSDALTPLAFLAAHTSRIRLGTAVVQLAARTPASTAMAAATIDDLAGGGRTVVGLGVSGPQIVEGWYGQPWGSPVARIRDYVAIMRKILRRDGPVSHDGTEISLPFTGEGATGQGKPLQTILHPDAGLPIWIGCGGPSSVKLTAEIADGWLPMGLTPESWELYEPWIREGLGRAGRSLAEIEIQVGCHVEVADDLETAWARRKKMIGFYVGGMGSKTHNFHKQTMIRRGYPDAADEIQELFLAGRRDEAYAAVPDSYIDDMGLYGDEHRIRRRYQRYVDTPITGLTLQAADPATLELMADIAGLSTGETP